MGVALAPQAVKNSTYRELLGVRRTMLSRSAGELMGFLLLVTWRKERVQLPRQVIPMLSTLLNKSLPMSLFR